MADRIGGNIMKTSNIDELDKRGKESQKAREAAVKKRREEEEKQRKEAEEAKRLEDMKKLSQDAGTWS